MCAVMDLLTCFHMQVWGFVRGIRILYKNARIHRCRMHPPSDLSGFDRCVRITHFGGAPLHTVCAMVANAQDVVPVRRHIFRVAQKK